MVEKLQNLENSQIRILNYFWLGFIIYFIPKQFLSLSVSDYSFFVPATIQSLGLILIFSAAINILKWRFEGSFLKAVFTIYIIWFLIILIRGLSLEFQFFVTMLFEEKYGVMPYLVPLLMLFPHKISFYKQLFSVILIFAISSLVFNVLFGNFLFIWDRNSAETREFVEDIATFIIPSGFILLTFKFHKFKIRIFSLIIVGIGLLLAIYGARRNLIFIYSTQILFSFLLYLVISKRKYILIIYSFFLSFFIIYYLYNTFNKDNPLFSYLIERGMEDTRTGVELAFYADLDKLDWIIGKGISGTYYSPGIEENIIYRHVIETGYLQIILKGGIISLLLLLLIAIPAIFLGIFHSKNTLSKAAGIWILLWVFYLYPTTMQAFSLYYMIFWVSIGIGYSKDIRNMSDEDILKKLYNKNKLDNRIVFDYHQ